MAQAWGPAFGYLRQPCLPVAMLVCLTAWAAGMQSGEHAFPTQSTRGCRKAIPKTA